MRPENDRDAERGILMLNPGKVSFTERELFEEFETIDPALLVREEGSVRGAVRRALKRSGWREDKLSAAGITAYMYWRPSA